MRLFLIALLSLTMILIPCHLSASTAQLVLTNATVDMFFPALGGLEFAVSVGGGYPLRIFCPQDSLIDPGLLYRACDALEVGDVVDIVAKPGAGRSTLLEMTVF